MSHPPGQRSSPTPSPISAIAPTAVSAAGAMQAPVPLLEGIPLPPGVKPPPPPGPDPRLGTVIGNYRVTGVLGRGAMGVVYQAEHVRNGLAVALKVMPESTSADPGNLRRFLLEADAASRLNHPNVVGIYEVSQHDRVYFMALELVQGGSAADFMKARGTFNWPEAARVVADACRGLQAAHEVGIIHRDIKPSNLMRARDGTVKISDFGLAKATEGPMESITGSGNVVGTPQYMSPEQCRAEVLDGRSDVYSMGATLFSLLVGHSPYFRAGATPQIMYAHCYEPVPDPRTEAAELPDRVANIVMKAMAKLPADRYQSAGDMSAALEAVLAEPEAATVTSEWERFVQAAGDYHSGVLRGPMTRSGGRSGTNRGRRKPSILVPMLVVGLLLALGAILFVALGGPSKFGLWNRQTDKEKDKGGG